MKLTPQQRQFLIDVNEGRKDPVYFAEHILGISLHDGQKKWLRSSSQPGRKRNILVPGNSFGKTVVSAVKQLWYLYYKVGLEGTPEAKASQEYRTAHMAPHSQQVTQCYNYMVQIMTNSFPVKKDGELRTNNCKIADMLGNYSTNPRVYIELANKSSMQGFSTGDKLGSSFQGAQFGLITFDECCREFHLEKIVTEDCLPRLIKYNAPIDLISTPWTESPALQYYYKICNKGIKEEEGWYTQQGSIDENVFYSEEAKDQLKKNMMETRPELYDQVVLGQFVFTGGREFHGDDINNIFTNSTIRWSQQNPLIEAPDVNGQYILAWDWAFATSKASSWSVFVVLNVREYPWKIVYFYRTRGSDHTPEEQFQLVRSITQAYNATLVIDGQSAAGALVFDKLQDLNPKPFMSAKIGGGRDSEKKVMILRLQQALTWNKGLLDNYGKLRSNHYIEPLASELGVYTQDDKRIDKDCVMALGMAVNFYEDSDVKVPYVMMEASNDI